jgi:large subunit ribosomal protein L19
MSQQLLESLNAELVASKKFVNFGVGDTISVSFRIVEGDKERQQVFQGVVISRKGRGIGEMVTIRKIVEEIGVERIFPLNSPMVAEIEMVRRGDARRAKLYFLRERTGKSRRLRDKRRGLKHVQA